MKFDAKQAKQSFKLLRNLGFDQLKIMEQEILEDVYGRGLTPDLIDKVYAFVFTVNLAAQQRNLSFAEYSVLLCDVTKMMETLEFEQ